MIPIDAIPAIVVLTAILVSIARDQTAYYRTHKKGHPLFTDAELIEREKCIYTCSEEERQRKYDHIAAAGRMLDDAYMGKIPKPPA